MPAELTITDGQAEMFYAGSPPWHKLGTYVGDENIDSATALEKSGLLWKVGLEPVYQFGQTTPVSGYHFVSRQDNHSVLGMVRSRYTPIQNEDMFKFFDSVVGEGQAIYHTAGSLLGGKKIWILAQLPGTLEVTKEDKIEKFLLLSSSHDGTMPLVMKYTPVRVVCYNTWNAAMGSSQYRPGGSGEFRSRHTARVMDRVNLAREVLNLSDIYFSNMMEQIEKMVKVHWSSDDAKVATYQLLELDPEKGIDEQHLNKRVPAEMLVDLFRNGRGNNLDGVKETPWAWFNAVTELADHHASVGHNSKTANIQTEEVVGRRLNSAWFGANAELKQKAWDLALSLN